MGAFQVVTPPDLTAATLSFDPVILGVLVMLIMQIVKGFYPSLDGKAAEGWVLLVSLLTTALILWSKQVAWRDDQTYVVLVVEWLKTTIVARGTYSMLFKVSVQGMPPSSEASVSRAAIDDPAKPDTPRAMTPREIQIAEGRR